jgi:hypothetical protein
MVVVRSAAASWLPMNNNVPQTPPAQPAVGFERHSEYFFSTWRSFLLGRGAADFCFRVRLFWF